MARAGKITFLASVLMALAGCASARVVEPGLANAPAVPLAESIDVHDVIANGHDSCPRGRVAAGDPLFARYPPCAGRERTPTSAAFTMAPATPAEHTSALWNLHLHGLPPCEGPRGESSVEVALALCSGN